MQASGPNHRGETLRIEGERAVVGSGQAAGVRVGGDPAVVEEHAEIVTEAGEFSVKPLGGPVAVDDVDVVGRRVLSDGEMIKIGGGAYVFKLATAGRLQTGASAAGVAPSPLAARPSKRRRAS